MKRNLIIGTSRPTIGETLEGLSPESSIEYLFFVITREGEKKLIKGIRLDPKRLGVHMSVYDLRGPLFSPEKVVESKNPLFQGYLGWLKEKHGKNPAYNEALEMLENATAIVVTATYGRRIFDGPYSDIRFASRITIA